MSIADPPRAYAVLGLGFKMIKLVAYHGFGQSVEPPRRRWMLPYVLRVVLTLIVGAATLIAAFFFLFIVVCVLLGLAVFAIAAYSVRRFISQTRFRLQQRGHRVTRISVLHESPSESVGGREEYWSNKERHSGT